MQCRMQEAWGWAAPCLWPIDFLVDMNSESFLIVLWAGMSPTLGLTMLLAKISPLVGSLFAQPRKPQI